MTTAMMLVVVLMQMLKMKINSLVLTRTVIVTIAIATEKY